MNATAPAPATPAAKSTGKTSYIILSREKDSDDWSQMLEPVVAAGADAALRVCLTKFGAGADAREWVAVPARSWKPRRAKIETTTRVTLG